MTKEEKAEKEAKEKADFERRMQLLRATTPPSDDRLLKSVSAVELSPREETKESASILPGPGSSTKIEDPQAAEPPIFDSPKVAEPTVLLSPSQRSAARLYASNDPKLESLLDQIAHQVKIARRQRSGPTRRVTLNIDSDIFSRVSYVSQARRIDKIEVLTYLLGRYLPEAGRPDPPNWITQERTEEVINSSHLMYIEDAGIGERFGWLEYRFGLSKVDIVAAIVSRYLPAAPFIVPPKRHARRKRF